MSREIYKLEIKARIGSWCRGHTYIERMRRKEAGETREDAGDGSVARA